MMRIIQLKQTISLRLPDRRTAVLIRACVLGACLWSGLAVCCADPPVGGASVPLLLQTQPRPAEPSDSIPRHLVPPESADLIPTTEAVIGPRQVPLRTARSDSKTAPSVKDSLSAEAQDRFHSPAQQPSGPLPVSPDVRFNISVKLEAERRRQEKEERYQQLQDRLQRMIGLWQQQESAAQPSVADAVSDPADEQVSSATGAADAELQDDSADETATDPSATDSTADNLTEQGTAEADQPDTAGGQSRQTIPSSSEMTADPSQHLAQQLATSTVIDGPVDRIGLADNLYGMGEILIALEMYDRVDTTGLDAAEKYWIAFQSASCLRRLNRLPEAEERYRRLAGEKEAGWLATASRWWLDHIDQRRELETQLQRYQQILDSDKESRNVSVSK